MSTRTVTEHEQWKLFKKLLPRLLAIGDEIDLFRAEHD
jgi:hypothetical protein